jgi:hypothetical protein
MVDLETGTIRLNHIPPRMERERSISRVWHSCLGCDTDRDLTVYIVQMGIIVMLMVFCTYQLIHITECSSQQSYLGLLTLMIGIVCPNPKR